jgi:hypothetical protein
MSEHYPKGFLFLYTNGRVCVADGQGGQVPVNIPELIAERDALRAEVERLKEAQRWIPVSEAHPPANEMVLVCIGRWYHLTVSCIDQFGVWRGYMPTHWMPLPEPPKEVEKMIDPAEIRAIVKS